MAAAKAQVMKEIRAEAYAKFKKTKDRQLQRGMKIKLGLEKAEEDKSVDLMSAYDAVCERLNAKEQDEKAIIEAYKKSENFTRNFYKNMTEQYSMQLSDNEMVVRLHKELVYADRDFMVFNKPYNLHCTTDRTNHQRSIEMINKNYTCFDWWLFFQNT